MNDLLRVYALCVLVLCLKMFAVSCYQGYFRIRGLAFTTLKMRLSLSAPGIR